MCNATFINERHDFYQDLLDKVTKMPPHITEACMTGAFHENKMAGRMTAEIVECLAVYRAKRDGIEVDAARELLRQQVVDRVNNQIAALILGPSSQQEN